MGHSRLGRLTSGMLRFSVSTRIWMAAVAVAAPMTGMMLFLLVTGVNHDIGFSEAELAGNRYQRPLEALLRHIPAHGLLKMRERAGESVSSQIQAAESEIGRAFAALEAVQAVEGEGLQFTPEGLAQRKREHLVIAELKKEFKAAATTPSADAYAHLSADLRGMIAHAGDTSNLILDPDLDSYYTMDITLLALPQTQDRLAQMMFAGHAILSGTPTDDDKRKFAIYAAMLQEADHDRIGADVQTAINEDPNFGGVSKTLQDRLPASFAEYSTATKAFIALNLEVAAGARVVTPVEYVDIGTRARDASFAMWNVAVDELDVVMNTRVDGFKSQRVNGLALTGITLFLSSLLVLVITRSITIPLEHTSDALAQAAAEIASASDQLASSAHALSTGATQQAQSLETTTGTMNQIASLASGNADRSKSARDLMGELAQSTDESTRMLDAMVRGMDAIRGSSDGIARIIRTIDEIAFQTNVLSLNAAVEAARAGKAGAGFAVVADEVRSLAQRSADAAHETGTLIEESRVAATQGAEHVALVVTTIAQFMERIGHIRELMDEIDGASRDQALGVRQAASGVHEVERGVQGASATAEETAAASEELASQAAVARSFVEDLRAAIRGTQTTKRASSFDGGGSSRPDSPSRFDRRPMTPPAAARVA
jgi:methyl-accepting chemotaxis protein